MIYRYYSTLSGHNVMADRVKLTKIKKQLVLVTFLCFVMDHFYCIFWGPASIFLSAYCPILKFTFQAYSL